MKQDGKPEVLPTRNPLPLLCCHRLWGWKMLLVLLLLLLPARTRNVAVLESGTPPFGAATTSTAAVAGECRTTRKRKTNELRLEVDPCRRRGNLLSSLTASPPTPPPPSLPPTPPPMSKTCEEREHGSFTRNYCRILLYCRSH